LKKLAIRKHMCSSLQDANTSTVRSSFWLVVRQAVNSLDCKRNFFYSCNDGHSLRTYQLPEQCELEALDAMLEDMLSHRKDRWFFYNVCKDKIDAVKFLDMYMLLLDLREKAEQSIAEAERKRAALEKRLKKKRK